MYGLRNMLIQEQKHLEDLLNKARSGITEFPDGNLRISTDKGFIRFYHCTENGYGTYIPKKDLQLPRQLAQKAYQEAIIQKATARLKQITGILKDYADDEIDQVYLASHAKRQALIIPVEPTTEQLTSALP